MIVWCGLGILGAVLLAWGQAAEAQAVWLVANAGLLVTNYRRGDKAQALMFAVYLVITIRGVWFWWWR
jgi:hypothetical protein